MPTHYLILSINALHILRSTWPNLPHTPPFSPRYSPPFSTQSQPYHYGVNYNEPYSGSFLLDYLSANSSQNLASKIVEKSLVIKFVVASKTLRSQPWYRVSKIGDDTAFENTGKLTDIFPNKESIQFPCQSLRWQLKREWWTLCLEKSELLNRKPCYKVYSDVISTPNVRFVEQEQRLMAFRFSNPDDSCLQGLSVER